MELQHFEKKNYTISKEFIALKKTAPESFARSIDLSWSNWGFGMEPFEVTARRLSMNGVRFIELHGNRYGADLGYKTAEVRRILDDHDITTAGICGMFSPDNDLSSNRGVIRQNAVDYIRRQLDLGHNLGAGYMLIVPGAVGRPQKIDDSEFRRSADTLRIVGDDFIRAGIMGAVEPIRSAEVSFCHTVQDALLYIEEVNHPGIRHINGDVYHMQTEESHIGEAVVSCGGKLVNLHLADSNRRALGEGSLDVDTLIRALYLIKYNRWGCYVTPEPLGPGGDPYPAMFGKPDPSMLDTLVSTTVSYWRSREKAIVEAESER